MKMSEILSTSESGYPAANRTHCAKSKQQFPSHRQALAKISMSVTVVLIKIHAWHCIIILLRVSAWCDVEDVKIFKADFEFDICIECVPLLFSSFGARFLSKTVAAFPFDLDRKIHLLCSCANANNTSMVLLICACGCVAYMKGGFYVHIVREDTTHAKHGKFQFENILSLAFDTNAHTLTRIV